MQRLDNLDVTSLARGANYYVGATAVGVTVPAGVTLFEVIAQANTVYVRSGGTGGKPGTWPPAATAAPTEPWYTVSSSKRFAVVPGEVIQLDVPASASAFLYWY